MKVQIGMLIWKEMKSQGFSHAGFVKILRDKNVSLKNFFNMETIDVHSLIQISAVLKTNFFQFYEAEELVTLLRGDKNTHTISSLNEMIATQDKLLLTLKKMIRQQDQLIAQLKEHHSDEEYEDL